MAALLAKAISSQGGGGGGSPIPKPYFSPAGGSWERNTPLPITIGTTQTGGTMRYTKTGIPPTINTGTLINGTIGSTTVPANATTQLKAITIFSGQVSDVYSQTYDISPP